MDSATKQVPGVPGELTDLAKKKKLLSLDELAGAFGYTPEECVVMAERMVDSGMLLKANASNGKPYYWVLRVKAKPVDRLVSLCQLWLGIGHIGLQLGIKQWRRKLLDKYAMRISEAPSAGERERLMGELEQQLKAGEVKETPDPQV